MKREEPKEVYVFDFGSVIFKTDTNALYGRLFKEDGRTEEELEYFLTHIFTGEDRSRANNLLSTREVTGPLAAKHPEWAKYIEAFNPDQKFILQVPGTIEGMEEELKKLKAAGHEIYGLTNWAGDSFDKLSETYPHITGLFNHIVVSGKVGVKKPNPRIYEIAQKAFGNPDPANVYFFDDKPANTEAANKTVGWNGVPFKTADDLRKVIGGPKKGM